MRAARCTLRPARIARRWVGLVRSPGSLLLLARVCPRTVRMLDNPVIVAAPYGSPRRHRTPS
eukprot:6422421-Prymnesium_polylepis.1